MTRPGRDNASTAVEQAGADKPQCVQDFVKTLLPDEKQLFDSTVLAKTLVDELKRTAAHHKATSSSRRVGEACLAFISGVELYGKGLDVFANGSDVLCPLWGSVRVIFELAKEFGEYFIKLGDMLENIGLVLARLPRFPGLYPDNAEIKTRMADIYDAIFEFCAKARHVFRVGKDKSRGIRKFTNAVSFATALRVLWKPFSVDFDGIRDRIAKNVDSIEAEADMAEKEIAGQERKTDQARWAAAERSQRLLADFLDDQSISLVDHWLAPVNIEANHKAASILRHDHSGSWFLEGDAFKSWLVQDNAFLWLYAIPGAGKTVLASSIINHIRQDLQNRHVALAYFYCDYKDTQKRDPAKLLATVLGMLAKQSQGVFENLQTFFLDQSAGLPTFAADFATLVENFPRIIRGQFETIFLVVDAMDETDPPTWDDLAHGLRSIHEQCSELKILVTSRNELPISRAFDDLPKTSIEQSDVASDINNFITAELSSRVAEKKLKLRNSKLQDEIRETLVKGSTGMFQWARCQIESLCKLRNDNAIRAALFNLPRTLQDTYYRLLQRIEDRHPEDIETFRRVLNWLVRGVRDLTLDELAEAISIDPESDQSSMDFGAVDTDPDDILGILGGLVVVSADKIVSLAHYSVKEYLVSEEVRATKPNFWIGSHDVERDLAAVCLAYLCYDDFRKPLLPDTGAFEDRLGEYKFLAYAAMAWPSHLKGSGKQDCPAQEVLDLAMRLLSSTKGVRKNYWSWEEVDRRQRVDYLAWKYKRLAPLVCAAWHGLSDAVRQLVAEEDSSNIITAAFEIAALNGHGLTVDVFLEYRRRLAAEPDGSTDLCTTLNLERALITAASHGHGGIIERLVLEGADVDARVIKDRNALHVAALEGHAQTVKLLLRHGASHNIPCKRYGTPLAAAAEKGHLKAVEVLLDTGANVNGRGGWYSSPLVSAIMSNNTDIIDLLIDNGAHIQPVSKRDRHPLWAAASQGLGDVVRDLVNRGASIKGSEALYAAASSGDEEVVEILLSLGADPDECGGAKYHTPLGAACAEGHFVVARQLINAGANFEYYDIRWGNALHVAASHGHSHSIRVLVKAGLDLFQSVGEKGSALSCAASFGHAHAIETILKLARKSRRHYDSNAVAGALIAAALGDHEEAVRRLARELDNMDTIGPMPNSGLSCTPLEAAASRGHLAIVKYLLEKGADPTFTNEEAFGTALIAAIIGDNSSREVIEVLLEAGCDPNVVTAKGCNTLGFPLYLATHFNQADVVRLLLANDADVNLQSGSLTTALQEAIWQQNTEIIDLLLEYHADVNIVTQPSPNWEHEAISSDIRYDVTALQTAACRGNEQVAHRLVALGAQLSVDDDNVPFTSALQIAAFCGHLSTLKALIEYGSDVEESSIFGFRTPLQRAAFAGHVDCARALLLAGADVNRTGQANCMSPLTAACCSKSVTTEMVSLLAEHGARVNARERDRLPFALHTACFTEVDTEVIELLLDIGADVNAIGGQYGTALQVASFRGNHDTAALLLRRGADPNITAGTSNTALQVAYHGGHTELIDLLYKHGALNSIVGGITGSVMGAAIFDWYYNNVKATDRICQLVTKHRFDVHLPYGLFGNALQHSIHVNCADAFDCILAAGAHVNNVGGYFGTALTAAAWQGNAHIVEALLSRGAQASLGNARFPNASFGAIWGREEKILQQLIGGGVDVVSPVSPEFGTTLQQASRYANLRIARTLVHAGAPVNSPRCGWYGSPLQAMINSQNHDGVRYLLRRGADISAKGGKFGSPLHAAALRGTADMVDLLLKKGADSNLKGGLYGTPLQAAAVAGKSNTAILLLNRGADVNATGGRYHTALQAACMSGRGNVVKLLVERGADVNARGGKFHTALNAAAVNNRPWAVRYLLEKGAEWSLVDRKIAKHSKRLDRADEILREVLEPEVQDDPGPPEDECNGSEDADAVEYENVEAEGEEYEDGGDRADGDVDNEYGKDGGGEDKDGGDRGGDEEDGEDQDGDEQDGGNEDGGDGDGEEEGEEDEDREDIQDENEDDSDEDDSDEEDSDREEEKQESDGKQEEGPLQLNVESIPGFAEPWKKTSRWDRVRENLLDSPAARNMLLLKVSAEVPAPREDEKEMRTAMAEVMFEELRMMQLGADEDDSE